MDRLQVIDWSNALFDVKREMHEAARLLAFPMQDDLHEVAEQIADVRDALADIIHKLAGEEVDEA